MRSDQTLLAAAAHHALRQSLDSDIEFKDCHWFGTSMTNQRIESWWGQLSKITARDQCVRNFWSGGPKFSIYQEFGVKAVLEELNTAIHA